MPDFSSTSHHPIRFVLCTMAATLVVGPILGLASIVGIYYWFSIVEGFELGPFRPTALAQAGCIALLPALIAGVLLSVLDSVRLPRTIRFAAVGVIGFASAMGGTIVLLGAGDMMGATLAGLLGILPAYGCKAAGDWLALRITPKRIRRSA